MPFIIFLLLVIMLFLRKCDGSAPAVFFWMQLHGSCVYKLQGTFFSCVLYAYDHVHQPSICMNYNTEIL